MRLSRGRPRRITLDMTPLIDVVLMLVIFFMLTTSFEMSPGIEVDLPQGRSVQEEPRERDTVITLTEAGGVYYQDARVSLDTLKATLLRTKRQKPGLRVVVNADKHVSHGRVVEIMDMAKGMGIDRIAIATAPRPRPSQP